MEVKRSLISNHTNLIEAFLWHNGRGQGRPLAREYHILCCLPFSVYFFLFVARYFSLPCRLAKMRLFGELGKSLKQYEPKPGLSQIMRPNEVFSLLVKNTIPRGPYQPLHSFCLCQGTRFIQYCSK